MPRGVGYFGEELHDRIVRDIEEQDQFLLDQLTPRFQNIVRWTRLYLADRDDPRGKDEKWRANVFVPYPFSAVETRVSVLSDIFNSMDPMVQAEGVGDEDVEGARKIERLFDYQFRKIRWRKKVIHTVRQMSIQGVEFLKARWMVRAHEITVYPSQQEFEDFLKALMDAFVKLGVRPDMVPSPSSDPEGFEQWRKMVNDSGQAIIPEPPYNGKRWVTKYRGPWCERIPIYDLRFDPLIDDIEDQPIIIHRMVKPMRWLVERTGERPDQPYDPQAVGLALENMSRADSDRLSTYEQQIAEILGITLNQQGDPFYKDAVEIKECYLPGGEFPFLVILNRKAIINKDPTQMPYWHGQVPIIPVRNTQLPGFLMGISDLQEPEALFHELNQLRNYRLDGVAISVMPVFQKLRELGLPDKIKQIRPGDIIPVNRMDAIQQLIKTQVPDSAFKEHADIKQDIDETLKTYGSVRGGPALIGRVSATENQQRFNQALAGIKSGAIQIEEDLDPFVEQSLGLWYQFGPPELRIRITGGTDPWLVLNKNEVFEAMEQDYKFRGATMAANRELQVQQMTVFGEKFAERMFPWEVRHLMGEIWETMGLRGRSRMISAKGDEITMQDFTMQRQMMLAQAKAQSQQGAEANVRPPATVSAETAAAAEKEAQAGGEGPPAAAAGGGDYVPEGQ